MNTQAGVTTSVLKHPRGLMTLFFTEMWERFSYYGMRALLVLFMVDTVAKGGMGLTDKTATAIYGLYTAFAYLATLPGGWVADRLLGAQRSVWWGGVIIAAGHFTLAVPSPQAFFLGLILVVTGTGLLKPNISAMVGQLYPEGGARRDAGFTIFYLGINLGAAIGPLICSTLGEKWNWHYGFGAAGVGMVLGLVQYRLTRSWLGTAGLRPGALAERGEGAGRAGFDRAWWVVIGGAAVAVVVVGLGLAGVIRPDPVRLAANTTYVIVDMAVLYFAGIFLFGGLDAQERSRVTVIVVLFIASAMFWSGFEQAGSSLNLFADRYTERVMPWIQLDASGLSWTKFTIPAGWFQSLNPFFIITLAPPIAALWVYLARRRLNPSIPVKFGLGLAILAVGFLVMVGATWSVREGGKVWPTWLIVTYLFHTVGEICLSPVGLSSVTKLAPPRFVGQMMGIWFLATSLGNLIAGLIAGRFDPEKVQEMPGLYGQVVLTSLVTAGLLFLFARPIKRWIGNIQ